MRCTRGGVYKRPAVALAIPFPAPSGPRTAGLPWPAEHLCARRSTRRQRYEQTGTLCSETTCKQLSLTSKKHRLAGKEYIARKHPSAGDFASVARIWPLAGKPSTASSYPSINLKPRCSLTDRWRPPLASDHHAQNEKCN